MYYKGWKKKIIQKINNAISALNAGLENSESDSIDLDTMVSGLNKIRLDLLGYIKARQIEHDFKLLKEELHYRSPHLNDDKGRYAILKSRVSKLQKELEVFLPILKNSRRIDRFTYENIVKWAKNNPFVSIIIISVVVIGGILAILNEFVDFNDKLQPDDETSSVSPTQIANHPKYRTVFNCRRSTCQAYQVPSNWIDQYDHTVLGDMYLSFNPINPSCRVTALSTIECLEEFADSSELGGVFPCNYKQWISRIDSSLHSNYDSLKILSCEEVQVENRYPYTSESKYLESLELDPPNLATRYMISYFEDEPMKAIILYKYSRGAGHSLMFTYPLKEKTQYDSLIPIIIDETYYDHN